MKYLEKKGINFHQKPQSTNPFAKSMVSNPKRPVTLDCFPVQRKEEESEEFDALEEGEEEEALGTLVGLVLMWYFGF